MEAIEQNSKIAYHLFKENCDARKYAKSCYKYATYLLAGKGKHTVLGRVDSLRFRMRAIVERNDQATGDFMCSEPTSRVPNARASPLERRTGQAG